MMKIFRNIDELYTLKSAAKKRGRKGNEKDLSKINNGCLVSDKGKLLWVGKDSQLPQEFKTGKEVSLQGQIVLPGFVEPHTHLIFAGNRSHEFEQRVQGVSYQQIAQQGGGILSTVKATQKATLEQLISEGQKKVKEFQAQGVTTVEIKSGYGLNSSTEFKILKAAQNLKNIRVVPTYLGPHAIPKGQPKSKYLDSVIRDLDKLKRNKISRVDMFIEEGYFELEDAKKYYSRAQELGLHCTVHTNQMKRSKGAQFAAQENFLSADHLNYLSKSDIQNLADSDTTCVFLPGADFYIKTQYPPARELIDLGARVGLSTDFNPGSCPTQDMQFVGLLARHEMGMTLAEVVIAYTLGNAYALGLEKHLGSLEVGKSADFISIETELKDLFYHAGLRPVSQVWLKGRRVFHKK